MKTYITKSTKNVSNQKMINQALEILESVGIPLDGKKEIIENFLPRSLSGLAFFDEKNAKKY